MYNEIVHNIEIGSLYPIHKTTHLHSFLLFNTYLLFTISPEITDSVCNSFCAVVLLWYNSNNNNMLYIAYFIQNKNAETRYNTNH